MRHFLKAMSFIMIVLVIILVGSPLAMSFWLQKHYQRILNEFTIPNQGSIKVLSFDRGWFESKATLQINTKVNNPALGEKPKLFSFVVHPTILQGPLVFTHGFKGNRIFFFGKAIVKYDINKDVVEMQSIGYLHWDGSVVGVMKLTRANVKLPDIIIQADNMHNRIRFNPSTQALKGAVSADQIQIQSQQNNHPLADLTFQKLNTQFDVKKIQALWVGKRSLNIDNINVTAEQKSVVQVQRFISHTDSLVNNNKLSGTMNIYANKLILSDLTFSPIKFDASIQDVDVPSLATLINTAAKIEQNMNDADFKDSALLELYQPAMRFLSKGFSANLDELKVGTKEGDFVASGKLVVPVQENADDLPYLLRHVDAKLTVAFPRALLGNVLIRMSGDLAKQQENNQPEKAPAVVAQEQIQNWINSNLLVQQGDNLTALITFSNGKLLVNGKVPNLDEATKPAPTSTETKPEATVLPPAKPVTPPEALPVIKPDKAPTTLPAEPVKTKIKHLQTAPVKMN